MKKFKIALDWTPNTNHTGIFVAQELGYFAENNIDLEIISPANDDYLLTPAKKLELGQIDLAIVPTESLLSLRTKENIVDVKAFYAILQNDTSAIVTLKSSNIERPKDLDGKIYASFKARYEDQIVKKMIINDGGLGAIKIQYPKKLGIWDTILQNKSDASWIFRAWEGIEAQNQGVDLNYFSLKDYGIPYGYTPIIIAKTENLQLYPQYFESIVNAIRKGYLFAKNKPEKAVNIVSKYISKQDLDKIDVLQSQLFLNPFYGTNDSMGKMDDVVFQNFIDWLFENQIIEKRLLSNELFTNQFFKN